MQKTYVPALERLLSIKTISVSTGPIDASAMMKTLVQDNKAVVNSLTTAYNTAEEAGEFGLSNILQDRISAHKKHGWMLESFTK
jgi:DNA-binding ferritin-like protein